MEKIIYLSKKLKAFTVDEIFLLAEMEKESLEKCLYELIENGTISYIYTFKGEKLNDTVTEILNK